MSTRPRYGSNGIRDRSAYGQPAPEVGWPSWRDMRPVLLKSAGIVGLAGAIMAVVSSNALFVDPGGPDRPSQQAASEERSEPAPIVIAASSAATEYAGAEDVAPLPPQSVGADVLPTPDPGQPETTASVIPAERRLPVAALPAASEEVPAPAAPEEVPAAEASQAAPPPAASEPAPAPAPVEPATATSNAPPPAEVATATAASDPVRGLVEEDSPPAENRAGGASAPWPKDSVECPRDWVASAAGDGAGPPAGCETIAALVQPAESNPEALRQTLPEDVLDLVALAPTIPVPDANADAKANTDAKPEPKPKPKPVRARRSDWPAAPPPDCGGLHAYWRFVEGHHGAKEWYCK